MKDKKNIDRLFQEKFKDFEDFPKEKVWKNIKRELDQRKKRRIVVLPLWSKIAGIAAAIALLFLLGDNLFFTDAEIPVANSSDDNAVNKTEKNNNTLFEQTETSADEGITVSDPDGTIDTKNTVDQSGGQSEKDAKTSYSREDNTADQKDNSPSLTTKGMAVKTGQNKKINSAEKQSGENTDKTQIAQKEDTGQPDIAKTPNQKQVAEKSNSRKPEIAETEGENQNAAIVKSEGAKHISKDKGRDKKEINLEKPTTTQDETDPSLAESRKSEEKDDGLKDEDNGKRSLLEAIANQKTESDKETKADDKPSGGKLALRPNVAPIYYNSFSGGSPVDPKFSNNKTEGDVTMSYGINLSYTLSKRVKIRSGISKVNMSYNTTDIAFTSSPEASSLKGLRHKPKIRHIAVMNKNNLHPQTLSEFNGNEISPYTSGKLNQQLGFIEVPLEVEYALLDQRFAINLIGGASTLFLNEDTVHINSAQGTTDLGKAGNINSVSFTTNLGLGFGYDLTKKLNFSLEPTFKYQLNGFSGDTGGFEPYYFGVYTGLSFKF